MNAVAPGFRSYIYDRVSSSCGLAVENLVLAHQSEGKCVYQRIATVAGLELRLAAQVWDTEAVAVAGNAAHHAFYDGMVLLHEFRFDSGFRGDWPESQGIHDCQ